jgi:hypothetical protein
MLRTSDPSANPDIQRTIQELLQENANFDRTENRSAHRDHLVRPVEVQSKDGVEIASAFSRNISATGIGLITPEPVDERTVGVLRITRLKGNDVNVIAECRWCKPYGVNWYLSGWQFLNLKR